MHDASATVWTLAPVTADTGLRAQAQGWWGHTPWGSAEGGAAGVRKKDRPWGWWLWQWF